MNIEYVTLSDAEQKEEAVRAIVTAHIEFDAMIDGQLATTSDINMQTVAREENACEWLSLCK